MTEADAVAPDARPPFRVQNRRLLRHLVTTVVLATQAVILYAGCWFSLTVDAFGCARSDPGFEPHGDDPLHGVIGFVVVVTALFTLGAGLTRRWFVVAAELLLLCSFTFYLSAHPNDRDWCHLSAPAAAQKSRLPVSSSLSASWNP